MTEAVRKQPWGLWLRQVWAVCRLELHKSLLQRKAWWILPVAPVFLTGMHSILAGRGLWNCSLGVDTRAFASIFQLFILRFGIFFGCAGIFSTLFRGEMTEKTLHYYFMTPVRREVLAAGKYLAGEMTALLFFVGGTALSYILMTLHFGSAHWERLLRGPGLYELGWYVIVATLACLGYGAIFLGFGLWFKNPAFPAAALMIWEGINPFLPSLLKKVSVIFYLQNLCPTDVPMNGPLSMMEILTDPTPAWIAIPGLLVLTAVMLVLSALTVRGMEVNYGD